MWIGAHQFTVTMMHLLNHTLSPGSAAAATIVVQASLHDVPLVEITGPPYRLHNTHRSLRLEADAHPLGPASYIWSVQVCLPFLRQCENGMF